ncbi:MAG: sulfite exporter TauE/SafE family protein [Armatimonadetes bacterium]|nr:sulfite exporter TauE/SafE family protein [Armatimonadota bacterium]
MAWIAPVLIGVVIGFLSGLFGVGGSSISTPLLRMVLGVDRLIALATPLPVTLPTALAGGWTYHRKAWIDFRTAIHVSVCGVPAVVAGSYLSKKVPDRLLMALTALVVILIGFRLLRGSKVVACRQTASPEAGQRAATACLIGVSVGFMSGLLANGGGFLLVPAFILILNMEMQKAAGTSLLCVTIFAVPGTIVHWSLGHIDPALTLALSLGVLPGTFAGARLAARTDPGRLRNAFGIFLLLFGLGFLIRVVYHAIEAYM